MIGTTISHYRITAKLGEGGMGVVYKAEDTRLDRNVALKFLSTQALGNEEEKRRFLREAQAAALLDHPNIAAVYDFDEIDGQFFIAMAYVDGPTLTKRIAERPLKLAEALDLAIQICEGIEEAHEEGVTHRDIKPANIIISRKGRVKITDFGLAQLAGRSRLTKSGTMLGTPAYMSPEQALGESSDRRADIWAVGIVMYEMIAGKRPFESEYEQATIFSIINENPEPLTAVRTGLPTDLDHIISKALAKRPQERYQHIDELLVDLRRLRKGLSSPKLDIAQQATSNRSVGSQEPSKTTCELQGPDLAASLRRRLRLYQVTTGMAAIAALIFVIYPFREAPRANPTRRFAVTPTPGVRGDTFYSRNVAVSPNGKYIAFAETGPLGKLWVRDLDRQQPRVIDGTEGAYEPFWSPDSKFIGFATTSELRKVPIQGGVPVRICPLVDRVMGGTWSPDGEVVVFSSGNPPVLYEVAAGGGSARIVLSSDNLSSAPREIKSETQFAHPHFLPSEAGRRVLVFNFGSVSSQTLMVRDLESGRQEVLKPGAQPVYSPSGHLVYRANYSAYELWALPFSLRDLKATGEPFMVAENGGGPTVAIDGTLVYLDHIPLISLLRFVDRKGALEQQIGQPMQDVWDLRLSPDGRRVAFSAVLNSNRDVWILDLTNNLRNRLTTAPEIDFVPTWATSEDEVAFSSDRRGNYDILLQRLDSSGEPRVVVDTPAREITSDWSRDGKYLIYRRMDVRTRADIWYLLREGTNWMPHPFLETPAFEAEARFSPDGRFVAYVSDQSGRQEVYVRAFPQGEKEWRISRNGGGGPRWSPNGKELFYVEGHYLFAAPVYVNAGFSAGEPTRLFDASSLSEGGNAPGYDVSSDGRQFLLAEPVMDGPQAAIRIVENWHEEFRDSVRP